MGILEVLAQVSHFLKDIKCVCVCVCVCVLSVIYLFGPSQWLSGEECACNVRDAGRRTGFDPWVGKVPWSRKWHLILVFLLVKSHGQRSLVGYSLWGCKELDMTE